jgi:hypothetical protein
MPRRLYLLSAMFCFLFSTNHANAIRGSDWPSIRHDGALTGQSPLRGGLGQAPIEKWSVDLGGPMYPSENTLIQDVNGDGKTEVLRATSGSLVCQTLAGKVIWQLKNIKKPIVKDIRDYAGNGGRGILITYTEGLGTVYMMIDGKNGKTARLFQTHDNFGEGYRTGHILPGIPGQQYCYWWSGGKEEGWGHLFSFENGPARPTVRLDAYEFAMIYAPLHAFVDIDGDGRNDMVMLSHEQMWAWDLKTQQLKFYTTWLPLRHRIRSYMSHSALLPLKPGQLPSLLEISQHIPGVEVVTQDGKGHSKLLWRKLVWKEEYQYAKDVQITGAAPNSFMDIDADGQIEMMASVTNEHKDGLQHLVIWGADHGDRLFDEPGLSVLGVDDLDGDGKPEVILKRGGAPNSSVGPNDTLCIADFIPVGKSTVFRNADGTEGSQAVLGLRLVERWQGKGAEPLFKPIPPEGDLTLLGPAGLCNKTLWREKTGSSQFLMRIDGKVWSCKLAPGGSLEQVATIDKHEALGNMQEPPKLDYTWDGTTLKTTVDGKEVVGYTTPFRRYYLALAPVASTFDGQMRILIRNYNGDMLSVSADGSNTQKIAEKAVSVEQPTYRITDLDGDGRTEAMVCVTEPSGLPAVLILDGSGKVLRTYHPAKPGGEITMGPVGSLGPGNGEWFAVCVRDLLTMPTTVAYNGKTGEEMWRRSGYGMYDNEPSNFWLFMPTPIYDYNGDGMDDMVCTPANFYGITDVAHNKDLVDPMSKKMLSDMIPGHWTAYSRPSLIMDPATGKPRVILNKTYAMSSYVLNIDGWPVWHYGTGRDDMGCVLDGLGDLDGDGKTEIVTARKDGLLTAFNWDATNDKCPRCPPEEPLTKINHGGKIRWTYQLPGPTSDFASADLDGDGKMELLCGAADGKLYALKEKGGKCTTLWSVDLQRMVGSPIIADLNGDGTAEILVTSEDGRLHCLVGR